MEKLAIEPENYMDINKVMCNLEKILLQLSLAFPCELAFEKLSFNNVLKSVGIEFADAKKSDLEKVLDYMNLVREIDKDKLFIFVNMRSYFSDEQMDAFIKTLIGHDYKAILLESIERVKLCNTKRIIIDKDLCEI